MIILGLKSAELTYLAKMAAVPAFLKSASIYSQD